MTRHPSARRRRGVTLLLAVVAATFGTALAAAAHPLGNFTSNTALRLVVGADRVDVRYVLDLAEIPTTRFRQDADTDGDGDVDDGESEAAAAARCATLLAAVGLTVDGTPMELRADTTTLAFPEGQAGLTTTRLVCDTAVTAAAAAARIEVRDDNAPDRIGWREVTAVGDEVRLVTSDVPARSSTALLQSYPESALTTPERTTSATLETRPGGPAAPPDALDGGSAPVDDSTPNILERLSLAYTDLVAARELTPGFAVVAVLLAMLLGTLHALAPGHGKTVMAAYVVGQRGTARQALGIGATVAVTHTVGVLLLGLLLTTSEVVAPESVYPWLGVASGAIVVVIGAGLVRRAVQRRRSNRRHDHDHAHGHDHAHDHGHDHDHGHGHSHALPDADLGWRGLVALGVAGGMAPSPSALLVLLGASALGRAWFGVLLVIAYGVGLAGLLVVGGLMLVRVRGAAEALLTAADRPRLQRLTAVLPLVTGVAVVLAGVVIAARGFLL